MPTGVLYLPILISPIFTTALLAKMRTQGLSLSLVPFYYVRGAQALQFLDRIPGLSHTFLGHHSACIPSLNSSCDKSTFCLGFHA